MKLTLLPTRASPNFDKWRWLETQLAPECLEWVGQQNETTFKYLDGLPETQNLESTLQKLAVGDSRNPDYWVTGHLFRLRKSNENKQGVLEMARRQSDNALDCWRKVIDIDELGRAENQTYELHVVDMPSYVLGPNSNCLILPLSISGSDTRVLREVDIESGKVLENGFRTDKGRIIFAWIDADHILINHCLDEGPATNAGWPKCIYLWKRGTELRDAKLVWQADSADILCYVTSIITHDRRYGLIVRVKDFSSFEYYVVNVDGLVKSVPIPGKQPMKMPPETTSEHLIGSLLEPIKIDGKESPAGSFVACCIKEDSPDFGKLSVVFVPEDGETNAHLNQNGLRASQSRVYLTLTKRGKERCVVVEYRDGTWTIVEDHKTKDGSHRTVVSCDPYSNDVIVEESGLLSAKKIWLELDNRIVHSLHKQSALFDMDAFEVNNATAYSADMTEVDYFTLSPKSKNGPLRVLMTGYGAFGLSFSKAYLDPMHGGISLVPWLESGGAFAVPYIRGGGERGEEWHQAARREKRQRSYDDFIAVAEELIHTGFTIAGKIGVFGSSNGGLLAAVVGTQRPDLFGAVVSDVPITDMLRYHRIAMGAAWAYEYGDPEDPEMAKVLKSYSPYHNVRDEVKYPSFLVTVSTRDDRVGAGHARKFVARLQDAGATHAYLFEDMEGGHTVSDSFKNVYLMSRRVAFFLYHLG